MDVVTIKTILIGLLLVTGSFFSLRFFKQRVTTTQLTHETMLSTLGGTFTVPQNWYVAMHKDMVVLEDPDREVSMVLFATKATDAQQAFELAWKHYQPTFSRDIKQSFTEPTPDGWDEKVTNVYETTANEKRTIIALAKRLDTTWYIFLLDSSTRVFERRNAQIGTIIVSFTVPAVHKESFAGKAAHTLDAAKLNDFEQFVEKARVLSKVPGVAVGVIQNGKLIYSKGFGVRELGKPEPVTPETLFMIGSITKSLTTFMMARLVDEGLFTWDTPVTQLMPTFALGDEAMTKKLTMQNTVSASTGMPRQDMELLFNYNTATPESRLEAMKTMKPTTGFGETFQYSNGMVAAGGYIAAHALYQEKKLGDAYDTAMQTRVLDPIGMPSSTFDFATVAKKVHALPHGFSLKGDHVAMDIVTDSSPVPVRPAGALWSNIPDMARYLMAELNKGVTPEGVRVISEKNILKRREPQIKITDEMSYGLGWVVGKENGLAEVAHSGGTFGFSSDCFFLPEQNVGMIVLTNSAVAGPLIDAIKRELLEILFDGKSHALVQLQASLKDRDESIVRNLKNVALSPDKTWLASLVGTYTNPDLGKVTLQLTPQGVLFDAGEWKSLIGQKKETDGELRSILLNPPVAGFEFLPKVVDGRVRLILDSDPQHSYVFEQV
jgi:CubicO group peptidase (beta-lactamase class C family)